MTFEVMNESAVFEPGVESQCEQEHTLRNEQLVIFEACWKPFHIMFFHLTL